MPSCFSSFNPPGFLPRRGGPGAFHWRNAMPHSRNPFISGFRNRHVETGAYSRAWEISTAHLTAEGERFLAELADNAVTGYLFVAFRIPGPCRACWTASRTLLPVTRCDDSSSNAWRKNPPPGRRNDDAPFSRIFAPFEGLFFGERLRGGIRVSSRAVFSFISSAGDASLSPCSPMFRHMPQPSRPARRRRHFPARPDVPFQTLPRHFIQTPEGMPSLRGRNPSVFSKERFIWIAHS